MELPFHGCGSQNDVPWRTCAREDIEGVEADLGEGEAAAL
jgi:hypothetical protein